MNDFSFKWTASTAIRILPTKAWLSHLVNFKNTIWTWGHFRRTMCNKNSVLDLEKIPQKRIECFRLLFNHLAWIEHQFLRGVRDSRKEGSLWGMMRSVGGVRKSIRQSWLAEGLGLELLDWGFREFRKRFLGKRPALFKSDLWHLHQDNAPVHNSILVTDYLTKIGIKTVPHLPYRPDLAPCDIWLFPRGCDEAHWHAHTRGLPWGLPEVVWTVQQVHCSWRRLLGRGLEFHVCTINKSAHTKKVWKPIVCTAYVTENFFTNTFEKNMNPLILIR